MSYHAYLSEPDPEWLSVADQVPISSDFRHADVSSVREQVSKARIAAAAALGSLTTAQVKTVNRVLPLEVGDIPIRAYIPGSGSSTKHAIVFWIFGGGFWVGGIDDDDLFLRYLCGELDVVIVAVEYRRAPEHPFPIGLNDCYASLKWVAAHPQELHGDLSKGLIIAGISSGGNFATVVAQRASQDSELKEKVTGLAASIPVLIHPAAYPENFKPQLQSLEQNKDASMLGKAACEHLLELYNPPNPSDPDMSPLLFPQLRGLQPTYLQIDGMDPLRDEELLYAKLLQENGVPTKVDMSMFYIFVCTFRAYSRGRYPGFPHGFHLFFPQLKAAHKKRDDFKNDDDGAPLCNKYAFKLNIRLKTGTWQSADGQQINLNSLLQGSSFRPPKKAQAAKDIISEHYTQPILDFINENPTIFHSVDYFSKEMEKEGFIKLSEREGWYHQLKHGGKYYVTQNGSSLTAFSIPENYKREMDITMIASHVDALTVKLKPVSKKPAWDRDLGIGGRVIVKNSEGKIESKLVKLDWPIAQTQMTPVTGIESSEDDQSSLPAGTFAATQPAQLVKAIASELGIDGYSSILNWELELLDDKLCSWPALQSLIVASKDLSGRGSVNMCALYDAEEIGNNLRTGACSNLMSSSIECVIEIFSKDKLGSSTLSQTYANNFCLPMSSSPLTAIFHCDPNGNMATDSISHTIMKRIAEKSGHTLQVFQIRNDRRSGGTVRPTLSSAMGVRAIDAGLAQLSMHSIRAACGAKDPGLGVQIFTGFYQYFEEVDTEIVG
ncbi:hypothetical protein M422DRAFT_244882 [Sphaerobolus stellatus SS14]|nr:hypothetical protein M422DRAFT_244882 [Sphaerobolus stellatus SS14]